MIKKDEKRRSEVTSEAENPGKKKLEQLRPRTQIKKEDLENLLRLRT